VPYAAASQELDPGEGERCSAPESTRDREALEEDHLLRLASNCPRCGSRPALRITGEMAKLLTHEAQGARLGTYQCQRRGCGAIYDLVAGEFLERE
jgi:hypothetical protein